MAGLIERLLGAASSGCVTLGEAGVVVKQGVMRTSEEISCSLHDVCCLQGFEKWNKAVSSNLKALSLIPSIKGVFDGFIKELKDEQDLFYATQVFGSTAKLFKWNEDRSRYQLAADISTEDICYAIGNPFETLQFLQRCDLISYPELSKLASQWGSFHLFTLNEQPIFFKDIPVVNAIVNKPKDLCVFIASCSGIKKGLTDFNWDGILAFESKSIEDLCKLASNLGRVILIPLGFHLEKSGWIGVLTVVDLVTQNSSLFAFIIKRRCEREKSFEN